MFTFLVRLDPIMCGKCKAVPIILARGQDGKIWMHCVECSASALLTLDGIVATEENIGVKVDMSSLKIHQPPSSPGSVN